MIFLFHWYFPETEKHHFFYCLKIIYYIQNWPKNVLLTKTGYCLWLYGNSLVSIWKGENFHSLVWSRNSWCLADRRKPYRIDFIPIRIQQSSEFLVGKNNLWSWDGLAVLKDSPRFFLSYFVSKMGCQKWLPLCAPLFLTNFWQSRWCELVWCLNKLINKVKSK